MKGCRGGGEFMDTQKETALRTAQDALTAANNATPNDAAAIAAATEDVRVAQAAVDAA